MTADDFTAWLAFMRMNKRASSDAQCAQLLGVSSNTVVRWKQDGAPTTVGLACAALIHDLKPWTVDHAFMRER